MGLKKQVEKEPTVVVTDHGHEDRYAFGRWFRRMIKRRGIPVREVREGLGASSRDFNKWMQDGKVAGAPEAPDDVWCRKIAAFLGVSDETVLRVAAKARSGEKKIVRVTEVDRVAVNREILRVDDGE